MTALTAPPVPSSFLAKSLIFIDNSEEYNALRNSGLIELIDNVTPNVD